jgi:amino-acid N-acetyltransferase
MHAEPLRYTLASPQDLQAVTRLLDANGLPSADIARHLHACLVARAGHEIVGVVGLEVYGARALLRSLCVEAAHRRHAVAATLCDHIETLAHSLGVTELYLLTTTAEGYFARRGYRTVPRDTVPPEIAATEQFRALCPSTAICMSRPVTPAPGA